MTALITFGQLLLFFAGWFALAILAALLFHMAFGRKPKSDVDYEAFAEWVASQEKSEDLLSPFVAERKETYERCMTRYGRRAA